MTPLLASLFDPGGASRLFDDAARLQGMLDFEAGLARAQARLGVIPAAAAPAIAAKCQTALFDLDALAKGTAKGGNPAIPMVKQLTALVAADDPEAARFVHWGATSQDAMDTGLVLQLRALLELLDRELDRLVTALVHTTQEHRDTPLVARTWLQQALPTTLGVKAAGWLDALLRHRRRLAELRPRLLVLQLGGAAGTLAALDGRGPEVAAALAEELDLDLPDLPWHATRDRLVELGLWLGLLTGSLGKIGRDLSLLMQTEIGELFEPSAPGKGGSSTMPHKRNPVACAVLLAAAARAPGLVATLLGAMPQEHERGLGGWHAEWIALPELAVLAAGALGQAGDTLDGLEIDARRMRANLDLTKGLIMAEAVMMALGKAMGRLVAHERVEQACRTALSQGRHLHDVLAEDAEIVQRLGREGLARLFEPLGYVGAAGTFVDRVLARAREEG